MKTRLLIGLYPGGPFFRAAAIAVSLIASPLLSPLQAQEAGEQPDSVQVVYAPEYRRAMIVPFDMTYYLSDADHELAQRNDKSLAEVQQTFRYGLDGNVAASVLDLYGAHRILLDTLPEFNSDLNRLYGAVRYQYRQPFGIRRPAPAQTERPSEERPAGGLRQWMRDKGSVLQERAEADQADPYFAEGALRGPVEGRRVMHAELLSPEVLQDFYDRYGTDLFVFVNQLEIRTVYEHCLDRASNTFVRDISLHYSLYDLNGKLFAADVVTVMVSSNTRDLYEVMARAFPALSAAVAQGLPSPRYLRTEAPLELKPDE